MANIKKSKRGFHSKHEKALREEKMEKMDVDNIIEWQKGFQKLEGMLCAEPIQLKAEIELLSRLKSHKATRDK